MKRIQHVLVLWCTLLLITACGGDAGDNHASGPDGAETSNLDRPVKTTMVNTGERHSEQYLRRGNGSEIQTLDPHKAEGVPSSNVHRDLYEGLTLEAPDGSIIPGGAESWEISDDGLIYTFKIRKNGKWSDGTPVTAQDFAYGLQRSVNPATGSKYSQILAPIKNAEEIIAGTKPVESLGAEVIDDYTLKITLNGPTPYFLGLLNHASTYPMPVGFAADGDENMFRAGKLISNGAFRLTEWVVQSHLDVERNPYYWDNENNAIDKVRFFPIEDQSTELKRYRAGELDMTYDMPFEQFKWVKENLYDEFIVAPYLGIYYYGFNLTKPPFKDNLELRRALSLAVDRNILTEKVLGTGHIPFYSWVPEGVLNYSNARPPEATMSKAEREALAIELFEQAGYSKEEPLEIEIRYNTSENHKKIAIAIAAMWSQVLGVKAELVNEEWKVFLENRKQKQVTQVFRAGWIGDYADPFSFLELMHSSHGINDPGYNNPVYDDLLSQISAEGNPDKRRQLMEQAEAEFLKDYAVMPIYSYIQPRIVKPHVGGYQSNILDHILSKNLYIIKH